MSLAPETRTTRVSRSLSYFFAEIRHYPQSLNFTIKRKTEIIFSQSSSKFLARFMLLDESKESALVIHLFGIFILGVQSCSDLDRQHFTFLHDCEPSLHEKFILLYQCWRSMKFIRSINLRHNLQSTSSTRSESLIALSVDWDDPRTIPRNSDKRERKKKI